MRFRFFGLIAAVALIAACETGPDEGASTGGTGTEIRSGTEVQPGTQEDLVASVGDRVFFDFDKFNLKPEARAVLERQAAWMKKFPWQTVQIAGHADERGTREYNLALGERRANAVRDYLLALGIKGDRVKTISFGEERPVCAASNEQCWSQTRRSVTLAGGAQSL